MTGCVVVLGGIPSRRTPSEVPPQNTAKLVTNSGETRLRHNVVLERGDEPLARGERGRQVAPQVAQATPLGLGPVVGKEGTHLAGHGLVVPLAVQVAAEHARAARVRLHEASAAPAAVCRPAHASALAVVLANAGSGTTLTSRSSAARTVRTGARRWES